MIFKPRNRAGITIAVAGLAVLALAGFLFESRKPPGLSGPIAPIMADGCADEKPDDPADVARAEAILRDIKGADRDERLRLWREIDDLRGRSNAVRAFLFNFAHDEANQADPYPRFVAAATVAGFGRPSRLGPNNLLPGTSLGWYIRIQKGFRVSGLRRLKLAPALNDFTVDVAPNAKNDLTFTEILWTILIRHRLSFRLESDRTFLILPEPPLA